MKPTLTRDAAMNRIMSEAPTADEDRYVVLAPAWLTLLLRTVSFGFGVLALWLSAREWGAMPIWVNGLVCVLVPAFFLMALHPNGWARFSTSPFLVADREGKYFPSGRPLAFGKRVEPRWLFIGWERISNVRVDKAITSDGTVTCAAFDVEASAEEIREFLHDDLAAKRPARAGSMPVAFYLNMLPHPRQVVSGLVGFRASHDRSRRSDAGSDSV